MIFNRKKKQKLDESLCKLHPNYTYTLQEKREHYKEMFHQTVLISLAAICVCSFALMIISLIEGVHETKYTLPSGEVIITNLEAKVYNLEGQKLVGTKTDDNIVLSFACLGTFFGSFAYGIYCLMKY